MRVLSICADTGIDILGTKGAAIHVREMAAAFVRLGHHVELVAPVLTRGDTVPASTRAEVHQVPIPAAAEVARALLGEWIDSFDVDTSLPLDVRRMLYDHHLCVSLQQRYASAPPDLIYARASLLSTAGAELAAATQRPFVVELNAPLSQEQQRYRSGSLGDLYRRAEQRLLRAATVVTVVSAALVDYVADLGVDAGRVHVLPNGVDARRFSPGTVDETTRRRLGVPDGPIIGFVGGLRPWHGVERLPEVLAGVRARGIDASLVIAGDGPLRASVEAAATSHSVADHIVFLGAVAHDDIPDVVRSFTVAVAPYPALPHDFYYSPLKLFEYLGCGVPVVASAVGQIDSLLDDGVHARLVPPDDLAAFTAACAQLLSDPDAAHRLGTAGRALVEAHHTWDHNAARVIELAAG